MILLSILGIDLFTGSTRKEELMLRRVMFLSAALAVCISIPVAGQDHPKAEVYAGYQLLHDSGMNLNGNSSFATPAE